MTTPTRASLERAEKALPCECMWASRCDERKDSLGHDIRCPAKHWSAVAAAIEETVREAEEQCCKAIRAACFACRGSGVVRVTRDYQEVGEECECCGQPIVAIRSRAPDAGEKR